MHRLSGTSKVVCLSGHPNKYAANVYITLSYEPHSHLVANICMKNPFLKKGIDK